MKKESAVVIILALAILSSMMAAGFAAPPVQSPMGLVECTIEGGEPATVDYSIAYDTASGELIQNMMDTLVVFNAENTNQFLPSIATNWTAAPLGLGGRGIDSGLPISGLAFENGANQTSSNATYYYRYTFEIRQGVFFQSPYNYSLTPEDVAFSFQRTLLMDIYAGPQWMIQEPLLDIGADSLSVSVGGQGGDLANATQVAELGALIEGAVEFNDTHVWFNLMYPGAYAPFMQILTQTWSSIQSKQWINDVAIGVYGRDTWPGGWPDHTSWLVYHDPAYGAFPLDNPFPIMYGSGPWIVTTLDYTNNYWSADRNEMYWEGWPADFPLLSNSRPAGFVDQITVNWNFVWANRLAAFLAGDCDFCAVPRQYLAQVYKGGPPYDPNVPGGYYPLDGIRCIYPLPTLAVDAFFFTMSINQSTPYGPVGPADTFNESAVPTDFFGNPAWGVRVRQGFAQAFDYNSFISIAYLGEADHPATAIVPCLNGYDPTVTGWSYNLTAANASLNQVGPDGNGKMLKDVGFTLTLLYNTGANPRSTAQSLLKAGIESLNPLYHVILTEVSWTTYLRAAIYQQLQMFSVGWLADYPDAHDLALPFYRTGGSFSTWQAYSNPEMDALIDQGIITPDGPARQAIYHDVQVIAVQDCPSFPIDQPVGRHFERDWVVGWYYNPVYPGIYFYNLWKWYYQAEAQLDTPVNPPATTPALAGWNLPVDVNYDGKVDMRDIGIVAKAFATSYGPPQDTRWMFRLDINNDRRVDLKDIGLMAKQFGMESTPWPIVYSNITAVVNGTVVADALSISINVSAGTSVTFTETVTGNTTGYTVVNVEWQQSQWPGPLLEVQTGLNSTYTYNFSVAGTYYLHSELFVTLSTVNGPYATSICERATVTVT
jgi:peptide/nickel transport system substrate-binding protein